MRDATWRIEIETYAESSSRVLAWRQVGTIKAPTKADALSRLKAWVAEKGHGQGWRKSEGKYRLVREDDIATVEWTREARPAVYDVAMKVRNA